MNGDKKEDPENAHFWFQRRPRLALGIFALVGVLGALCLLELGARLLLPAWTPVNQERVRFWRYDELLGWAHTPGQRGRLEHPDFVVEVVINSRGLRDSEYPVDRTEKKRMLVLGDSFSWGFGVEDEERFTEVLEERHHDWEIINASVSGYGTDQELLYLREEGRAFKPDVVLLLFYPNDFPNNMSPVQYWHGKPFFVLEGERLELRNVPVPKPTIRQRVTRLLAAKTHLGGRLYAGAHGLLRLLAKGGEPEAALVSRSAPVTMRLLAAMRDQCLQNSASFVIVSAPMIMEKREVLQELAASEMIPYLALDQAFAARNDVTLPHDEHWNANGHEVAAGAIEAFLIELGLFAAKGSQ